MAIKDSIVNLKKGLRTTLTNVPALIDTLIRGLDGVEEEVQKGEVYSTDEHVVGTWIDGTTIYEKTLSCGALPAVGVQNSVEHGITNLGKILKIDGIAISNNWILQIGSIIPGGDNPIVAVYANATYVRIVTSVTRAEYTESYITIRYTKTSASRSPEENDTKNSGDEENEK
jgi:hypothetical protein